MTSKDKKIGEAWTGEDLAAIHRRRTGGPAAGTACLSREALLALAGGTGEEPALGREDRRRAVEHLETCAECSLELRTLRRLEPWAQEMAGHLQPEVAPNPDPMDPRKAGKGLGRSWLLAASFGVVLLGTALLWSSLAPDSALVQPAGVELGPNRGEREDMEGVLPLPGAELAEAPGRLQWSPQPGATAYRVRLYSVRAEELWASPSLEAPNVELPDEIRRALPRGELVSWKVEIEDPGGGRRLGPYRFRLSD